MKKRLVLLFVVLFILFIQIANAQGCEKFVGSKCAELEWERTEAKSGDVAEIVISPSNPDIMYAGFEVNVHSLYKSTDAGKTWKKIDGGGDHTKDIAISPKNPNKVYFVMSESLETTDTTIRSAVRSEKGGRFGGATRMILVTGESAGPSESSFSTIEIFKQNDKIIYAALKGGGVAPFGTINPKIFKTTNGGEFVDRIKARFR